MPRRALLATFALAAALAAAAPAFADEYDPHEAGHPLRFVAYLLHPLGVTFDYLVFRPAHWLVHHEPARTVFGHEVER